MATESGWAQVQVQVPEVIVDLSTALDTLVGALVAILDVALAVLEVVKAFAVGFIDPITAIIDAIVSEIESLLLDIRQIGVYLAGDFNVSPPFESLLGGFSAYERRMIGRLINRADPTRPAFSPNTAVAAVFLYSSFETGDIQLTLSFLSELRKFFSIRGTTQSYTVPAGLNVTYGSSGTGVGAFGLLGDILKDGESPTVANLRWQMTPPPNAGAVSWPIPAPPGFLVEVSTVPDGLYLAYQTPKSQAQSPEDVEVGLVAGPDGKPFKLYGGTYILDEGDLEWVVWDTYEPPSGAGATRLFAYRSAADNVPIPLVALQIDGKPILQRTFFVDVKTVLGINVAAPGQQFSTLLRYEDMPYEATFTSESDGSVKVVVADAPARDVYVRVSAVTSAVTSGASGKASTFYWQISESQIAAGAASVVQLAVASGASESDKSDASAALKITFPSQQASAYLDAVATALAVMVLSRADLIAQGEGASYQLDTAAKATGLEDLARYLVPKLLGTAPGNFLKKDFTDVVSFRGKLRQRCQAVANMLLAQTGPIPDSVLALVLDQATVTLASGAVKPLASVTWQDLDTNFDIAVTLLDSLDPTTPEGSDSSSGVGANPTSVAKLNANFLGGRIGGSGLFSIPLQRTPGYAVAPNYLDKFPEDTVGEGAPMSFGSSDKSPVIYDMTATPATMKFCRNVFLANPSMFTASQTVLNMAASSMTGQGGTGGEWTAYRLFPQGLPPVEAALNEITGFLNAITAGLVGVTDTIVAYINFLEARVLELEALLRRIQGLLDLTLSIQVPSAAGLIVTANGTDGILQALVTATNKPSDSAESVTRITEDGEVEVGGTYGAGAVVLAGGLPTAVLDLLLLLFAAG